MCGVWDGGVGREGGGHLGTANTCLPLIPKEILAHLGGIEGFLFSNFKLMSFYGVVLHHQQYLDKFANDIKQ